MLRFALFFFCIAIHVEKTAQLSFFLQLSTNLGKEVEEEEKQEEETETKKAKKRMKQHAAEE